ncbi:hypothetical protein [Aquimarina sediminis]|uniref:hypothetical protein n=1 Tax=Aquimarina sediminis TaxID=2070536 RepID=UPI000CA04508|nr:hypothetical protein [Aquimarina sediminis]
MNKEDFILKLKQYGVLENLKSYREDFNAELDGKEENIPFVTFIKLYKESSDENKKHLIHFMKQVIEDSLSIFLGLLDGSSNINQEGKFKLYYDEEGEEPYLVNNREEDDLLTLWYEDDED